MDSPLVTVGIPIYNTARFVTYTLDSIRSQTYNNIEIIVVDNASTDDSVAQIERWSRLNNTPVNLIRNKKNLGLAQSCNIILDNAKGKYLQKVDADDILLSTKIERHVQLLETLGEQTACVYSDTRNIDENGNFLQQDYNDRMEYHNVKSGDFYFDLMEINFIPNPSVLSRTQAIKEVGGYDGSLMFEDWDLWLRLAKKFTIYHDKNVTCYYRIHKQSIMADPAKIIARNHTNIMTFRKHIGFGKKYDVEVFKKLKSLSIYSYFQDDVNSKEKLRWFLKNKFDLKVLVYYVLAAFRIKHPPTAIRNIVSKRRLKGESSFVEQTVRL